MFVLPRIPWNCVMLGGEQSGETSVPAQGTGGNVFDLYQFINEYK